MKRACLLVLVLAASCAGSASKPALPETTRDAPVGIAYRWNDEGLTFCGASPYRESTPVGMVTLEDATILESAVLRSKPGRVAVEGAQGAIFNVLTGDLLVVDHRVHVVEGDTVVQIRTGAEGLAVEALGQAEWYDASLVVLREVGLPDIPPEKVLTGLEALIFFGAPIAKSIVEWR